eukprot:TRINITY_DN3994_c0_g2_i1.p1 TRINITY_DN3994_c0_g2~~TRINITY_DN3994_c0_g2_i1.p1  ORF type:complete len:213 (-),score=28.22 TRINITY_DN3994_c0_g2_i1:788-1426(-)
MEINDDARAFHTRSDEDFGSSASESDTSSALSESSKKIGMKVSNKSSRGSTSVVNRITFDQLSRLFELPLAHAARALGVCATIVKRACRKNGIARWPYQAVRKRKFSLPTSTDADAHAATMASLKARVSSVPPMPKMMDSAPSPSTAHNTMPSPAFAPALNSLATIAASISSSRSYYATQATSYRRPAQFTEQDMQLLMKRFFSFRHYARRA